MSPLTLKDESELKFALAPVSEDISLTGVAHGFCKQAREQYEKLSTMHKNMLKLYEDLGCYFAFDAHSVSIEDFFGDLANFRTLFLVSYWARSLPGTHEWARPAAPSQPGKKRHLG